jgi:CheY-like chemotaxis protein/signal transduction histidine kinase
MTMNPPVRILCIEDNPMNWRLVQRLLSQAGYEMHWAEEGLQGYELALELKPALVLLDINLPGLSGFEVATKFRQNEELKQIPLVALTAKTLKSDRETALVAGCDGFIPKPLDPFTFVGQVGAYLGGQREHLEEAREGPALRQFNVQVLEHLEARLKEAQGANAKLMVAQQALETRNKSLSRLLALSQDILTEHDPQVLLQRILGEVRAEIQATGLLAYRLHASGGYFEGFRWSGSRFEATPVLPLDHPFVTRMGALAPGAIRRGEELRSTRVWDEGLGLGFWGPASEAGFLVLRSHQDDSEIHGFWIITRPGDQRLLPAELEMITLHASIAMVSLENAELIVSLNNSTRALASSYERIEGAYQDLQNAKADLSRRDRQTLLGDLFYKIAQRLEAPVASLHRQSRVLDQALIPGEFAEGAFTEAQPKALAEIREAVAKIDGLLKALLRRVGREGPPTPEWLDLHDLIQQELGLLQAEGVVPAEVELAQELRAQVPTIFGVYGDFATILVHLVHHALGGPTPSPTLAVRSRREYDLFTLEVADEGGVIPPSELAGAFEPFSGLHQHLVIGMRAPGEDLAACKQLLVAYQGEISIANEGEGTCVRVRMPLR